MTLINSRHPYNLIGRKFKRIKGINALINPTFPNEEVCFTASHCEGPGLQPLRRAHSRNIAYIQYICKCRDYQKFRIVNKPVSRQDHGKRYYKSIKLGRL